MTAHESLVADTLGQLEPADQARFLTEHAAFRRQLRGVLEARRRGVSVAPFWRRPLSEVLHAEVERRVSIGDPIASVWAASAESAELAARLAEMEDEVCR